MRKKRVFIFIAALLVTLLMVVGCDVSPVSNTNVSDGKYVEFNLSVKDSCSRDLLVSSDSLNVSYYKIALVPEWNDLVSGAPIYGRIGSRSADGTVAYGNQKYATAAEITLGYVTPGKWTVYVAAFNSTDQVILDGYNSSYVNSTNNSVSVYLSPNVTSVSEKGKLNFRITVPRLSKNHLNEYEVRYTLYDSKNSVAQGVISGAISETDQSLVSYEFVESNYLSLKAGEYFVIVNLFDKTADSSVGGVTKKLSIISGSLTEVSGNLSPSEFVDVNIDYNIPTITAKIDDIALSSQVKDNAIVFKCTDTYNQVTGYNRVYRWFIDGELIQNVTADNEVDKWKVTAMSDNGNSSTITCLFNSYGKREVRCEIVYIPVVLSGESNSNLVRFIGGDSTSVEIIPR